MEAEGAHPQGHAPERHKGEPGGGKSQQEPDAAGGAPGDPAARHRRETRPQEQDHGGHVEREQGLFPHGEVARSCASERWSSQATLKLTWRIRSRRHV